MPIYEYFECDTCKPGTNNRIEVVRLLKDAHLPYACGACGKNLDRAYSLAVRPEFKPYYDEIAKTEIRSHGQERRAMRKTGRIYTADIPKSALVREKIDRWKHRRNRGEA